MLRSVPWLSAPAHRLALAMLWVVSLGVPWGRGGDLNDGLEQFGLEYRKSKEIIVKLFKGDELADPKKPQHEQAVDLAAQNATYNFTDLGREKKTGAFDQLLTSFDSELGQAARIKGTSPALASMFSRRVIVRGQEVLHSPRQDVKPIARVNVTHIMARLAKKGPGETTEDVVARLSGQGATELGEAMLKALEVKNNDGIKYEALHGLRDLLAIPPQTPPLLSADMEQKCVLGLVDFIQRRPTYPSDAAREEVEGFRVLRREAVKALAQYRGPSLKDKSPPALVLLKLVARDGYQPEPQLDERVDAAIGIARMKPDLDKTYQPEYAAQQLGLFIIDFASRYKTREQSDKKPWATQAARLSDALDVMKAESKSPYVAKVVDFGKDKLLRAIENNGDFNVNVLPDFASLLGTNGPSLGQLFSGVEGSRVPPPNRAEDAPEKPAKPADKPAKP